MPSLELRNETPSSKLLRITPGMLDIQVAVEYQGNCVGRKRVFHDSLSLYSCLRWRVVCTVEFDTRTVEFALSTLRHSFYTFRVFA
jgi:hypothetical protein